MGEGDCGYGGSGEEEPVGTPIVEARALRRLSSVRRLLHSVIFCDNVWRYRKDASALISQAAASINKIELLTSLYGGKNKNFIAISTLHDDGKMTRRAYLRKSDSSLWF